jgi:lysozyme
MGTSEIKEWQTIIGVSADGSFGPATLSASKAAIGIHTTPPPTTTPTPTPPPTDTGTGVRHMSMQGAYALATREGIIPAPYVDSVGVWTYGVGHTAAAGPPDPKTMPRGMPSNLDKALGECIDLYLLDLKAYEDAVHRAVTEPVNQAEFDALVSFHYNTGAISRATLTKTLNDGNHPLAGDQFMNWVTPPEVTARRQSEKDQFKQGKYPNGPINVWQVDGNGHVIWKVIRTVNYEQFLEFAQG